MGSGEDRALVELVTEIGTLREMVVRLGREVVGLRKEAEALRKEQTANAEGVDELFRWLREVHDRQADVPEEVIRRVEAMLREGWDGQGSAAMRDVQRGAGGVRGAGAGVAADGDGGAHR